MNNNDKKAIKAGTWYTVGNIISKGMNFLTVPIFTRFLTQDEFGLYNNFISWMTIFAVIATLNLSATLYSARYDYEKDYDSYKISIISLSFLTTFISMLVVLAINHYKGDLFQLNATYIILMFIGIAFNLVIDVFQIVQRIEYNYNKVLIVSITLITINIIISILLIRILKNNLFGRILGTQFSVIVVGLILLIDFLSKNKRIQWKYWKYSIKICIPFIPHLLSLNLLNSMDRVMITNYCGTSFTALYSVAYSCGIAIRVFTSAFNGAFDPWMCQNIHNHTYDRVRSASKKFIGIISLIIIGMMLLSPELLLVMGGASYLEAKYVMIPVILGCFCQFIYTFYVNVEQFMKETVLMAVATIIAAIFNYGTNWYFIPRYGYIAAAYTTLVSYGLLMVIHYFLIRKINLNLLFDNKFIVICFLISVLLGIGISYTYENTPLRLGIVIVYSILIIFVLFRNKNVIINIFNK